MPEDRALRGRIVLAFAAIYVLWGSTYLGIRYAVETIPPFLMAGTRHLVAGLILYAWTRSRSKTRPKPREWALAAAIGAMMLLGGNGLVSWAEQRVPSGLAALIVASVPTLDGPSRVPAAPHGAPRASRRRPRPGARLARVARRAGPVGGPRRHARRRGAPARRALVGDRLALLARREILGADLPGGRDGDDRGRNVALGGRARVRGGRGSASCRRLRRAPFWRWHT